MGPHRVMIVDDEKNALSALRRNLASAGRELECYTEPGAALRRAQVATFDLVLADLRMPYMDGVTLLSEVRALQPEAVCMIISAHTDFKAVVNAVNRVGIERFIPKPWSDTELQQAVSTALEKKELLAQNRRLADRLRRMERVLAHQREELARLERENPGLTQVRWSDDGRIVLDEGEL